MPSLCQKAHFLPGRDSAGTAQGKRTIHLKWTGAAPGKTGTQVGSPGGSQEYSGDATSVTPKFQAAGILFYCSPNSKSEALEKFYENQSQVC